MKYRIIELMHASGEKGVEFVIERRRGFIFKRWKEIFLFENGSHKRISHETYQEAEKHLLGTYTKAGIGSLVIRSGNVYRVERYNMYTM